MVEFPSNYPVSGSQGPSPTGDSPGSIDNNTTFIQLVDAAWEAIGQDDQYPTDLNTQTAMQAINNLNAYLTANPPTDPNNPKAYSIEQALSSGPPVTSSLAEICANYGTSNCQAAVEFLETATGNGQLNTLQGALDSVSSATIDSGNATIQLDINHLQTILKYYNDYMQEPDPQTQMINDYLAMIAQDISQLDTDAQAASPALSDGYLTNLMTYLNTPLQVGGTQTLQTLSAAILANNPPNTTDLDNLGTALQTLAGQNSSLGEALQSLILQTIQYEYHNSS